MTRRQRLPAALALVSLTASPALLAQQSQLQEIVVTGSRSEHQLGKLPLAISLVSINDIQLGRQELGLDESLTRVPGLVMQNRYNFSQDLRVSIRGFGARSSFGIRGIKVYSDGIPVTLPDGQSGTDDIDLGSVQSVEIVRGPAASLYGTAAGGVISINSEDPADTPFMEAKFNFGRWGHERYQFKASGKSGQLGYLVNTSYLEMDGYRDWSELEHKLLNTKFTYDIDSTSRLTAIFNLVDSPLANDAGGITLDEVAANPRQAQSRNVSSNAGEAFDQQRLGLVYDRELSGSQSLTLRAYTMRKDFQNFLPIGTHIPFVGDDGVVEFDRSASGGGATWLWDTTLFGLPNQVALGVDYDVQKDKRSRFINNAGVKGGRVFHQTEEAESLGFYFRNETALTSTLSLSIAGRFDNIDLKVRDHYLANGDQSGALDFNEFNPSVGLLWSAADNLNFYINYATAFETPTFTELGTPAQSLNVNLGGFNNVTEQEADSIEVGVKGELGNSLFFDFALYSMDVKNEITNVVSIGNRAFFENADTDRRGFEAQLIATPLDSLRLTAAYTFSDFTFDRFSTDAAAVDKWVPGIPRHQFFGEARYNISNDGFIVLDALYSGKYYADNTNASRVDSSVVANLRFGATWKYGKTTVSPFIGINNLFDEEYFSNVRVNAVGGRAYEPGPERHLFGGVAVRF